MKSISTKYFFEESVGVSLLSIVLMKISKQLSIFILSFILSFQILYNPLTIQTHAVGLNRSNIILPYGEGFWLKVNGTNAKITWSSCSKMIATVSQEGFVRAKHVGTTVIFAQYGNHSYSCKVTVTYKKFNNYNLTNTQLKKIAAVCYHEQSSNKGAAAEASLMANLFESSRGKGYGSGAKGLYNYVRNSGWFAHSASVMDNKYKKVPTSIVNDVKRVLVDGKRVLPNYVDEHDCLSDIKTAKNNGVNINKKNRKSYKKHVTKIVNRYKTHYTFYKFPDSISDPFGYTSNYKKNKSGEFCYSYSDL